MALRLSQVLPLPTYDDSVKEKELDCLLVDENHSNPTAESRETLHKGRPKDRLTTSSLTSNNQRCRRDINTFRMMIVLSSFALLILWGFSYRQTNSLEANPSLSGAHDDTEETDSPIVVRFDDNSIRNNDIVQGNYEVATSSNDDDIHKETENSNNYEHDQSDENIIIKNDHEDQPENDHETKSKYEQGIQMSQSELIEKYGSWGFYDGSEELRPTYDYMSNCNTNRDCPGEDFPDNSWQIDAVYMNHFLDASANLISRAKEAIYTEYGLSRDDVMKSSNGYLQRRKMFHFDYVDLENIESNLLDETVNAMKGSLGWTTRQSFKGFTRRLLHAMMTNDDFTVVVVGDAVAAGHGNHFSQSYAIQFHQVMEPIFKRLGVNLITRNLSSGKASPNILGLGLTSLSEKIDVLIWDEQEPSPDYLIGFFFRQALMANAQPPVLIGGSNQILRQVYLNADADIFQLGDGMEEIPLTVNDTQAKTLPWAVRYLKCPETDTKLCDENQFQTTCWVDRDDYKPVTPQLDHINEAEKYPGYRHHKLKARVLTFVVLLVIENAIDTWGEVTQESGHPLMKEHWHVTSYLNNIQSKASGMDSTIGMCNQIGEFIPERACTIPLHAKTESTPRSNMNNTSIFSMIKHGEDSPLSMLHSHMAYTGPDVPNPSLDLFQDEIDVRSIVSNRRELIHYETVLESIDIDGPKSHLKRSNKLRRRKIEQRNEQVSKVVLGDGWILDALPGQCDGTADAICGRLPTSNCLLSGYIDYDGGIIGNKANSWLVFGLDNVKDGIIIVKLTIWSGDDELNSKSCIDESTSPDEIIIDYAIDGTVTSLSKTNMNDSRKNKRDNDFIITLLDDPTFTEDTAELRNIEVGLRLNLDTPCSMKLTDLIFA